jgi:hypothetical protein
MIGAIFGYAFLVIGAYVAVMNWLGPIRVARTGRGYSLVPLFGGLFLGSGTFLLTGSVGWSFLVACLDPGFITLPISVPWLVYVLWSTSRFARVHQFVFREARRTITIELFRDGTAKIRFDCDQIDAAEIGRKNPRNENRPPSISELAEDTPRREHIPVALSLAGSWRSVGSGFEVFGHGNDRRLALEHTNEGFIAVEENAPADLPPYMSMNGLRFFVP